MTDGSPYAPHTEAETGEMLDAIGAESVEDLFDIPGDVEYDEPIGIESRGEPAVEELVSGMLGRNDDLTEFLGRGHYDHYVPAVVDSLSGRSEFLTSYTQYQPEIAQGFLQALFEYQSMLVELTGLPVANASMYDAATALGEAALLSKRVSDTTGSVVLVPDYVRDERVSVLENYTAGHDITVSRVRTDDGTVDVDALSETVQEETLMVYAESPTTLGTIEENLSAVGDVASGSDALFVVGSDPVALSLLEPPASAGADVVIGDAGVLGLPTSYGMGLGMFATRKEYLRDVPGRLVGAGTDRDDNRAYTLTLQTREQHIRRERATSNICTNQAWLALRTAMHVAALGPDGLIDLASRMVDLPREVAAEIDAIDGISAPKHDRHHFREFVCRTDRSAPEIASALEDEGFAVHAIGEHDLQICVTETNEDDRDDLVAALKRVIA
ncbi:MAG: aminomethyl-transferring glycine dehydrogenase subunit GcvPA [Halodesulfurarchaeum sp.]